VQDLHYICDDEGGRSRWFHNLAADSFVCLRTETGRRLYDIKRADFPTLDGFTHSKMRRFIKDGLNEFLPPEKLRQMSMPKSQAVMKVMQYCEAYNGNNN